MVFPRKVRTASGATAVHIAVKEGRRDKVLEHLGSARTEAELAALMQVGREKLSPGQGVLDLDPDARSTGDRKGKVPRLLIESIRSAWSDLGFKVIGDEAFFQLVLARLVEPTSKLDSLRVLTELDAEAVHLSTFKRAGPLRRTGIPRPRRREVLRIRRLQWRNLTDSVRGHHPLLRG